MAGKKTNGSLDKKMVGKQTNGSIDKKTGRKAD